MEKIIVEKKQGKATILGGFNPSDKKLYLESYGCQMNFSDSEIVASILDKHGYQTTRNFEESDLILLNTCSIREKAEITVRNRLKSFNKLKKHNPKLIIGMLGCMAERMKASLLEEEKPPTILDEAQQKTIDNSNSINNNKDIVRLKDKKTIEQTSENPVGKQILFENEINVDLDEETNELSSSESQEVNEDPRRKRRRSSASS